MGRPQNVDGGAENRQTLRSKEGFRLSQVSKTPKSAAERMRRYRNRRRRGERIVRVRLGPDEIEALVSRGYLLPGDRDDADAIQFGMSCLIDEGCNVVYRGRGGQVS
jgi:hypothetical protein